MCASPRSRFWTGATAARLLLLASLATGCGSGGGGGASGTAGVLTQPPSATYVASGSAAAADLVRTTGHGAGDLVTVAVVIGGPTSSGDLYSFAFDLKLGDPSVAAYVPGSASAGGALTTTGAQSVQVLAAQQADRVTVGVTKLGGGSGNGVGAPGEATVVELVFRLLRAGTTSLAFEGPPGAGPVALDSSGADIGSVRFDAAPATLTGL